MIHPIMEEIHANIKTPEALISFISFISGFISVLMILDMFSTAVLKTSALMTNPIQSKMAVHSPLFNFNIIPAHTTINEMITWILKLISESHIALQPAQA